MMKLTRTANETWLHHKEREWVSGSRDSRRLHHRFFLWLISSARRLQYRLAERRFKANKAKRFADRDLLFAAGARCKGCGAGLAYPKGSGMRGEWDCSAVLKGEMPATKDHPTFPFMFYDIKSEDQPSANGRTTRPGCVRVIHGALRNKYEAA